MEITISLDKMTVEEKLAAMELLWDDLCKNPDDIPSPSWHNNILQSREERLKNGKEKVSDWQEAKKRIRESIK
jgi:hypothetical protein